MRLGPYSEREENARRVGVLAVRSVQMIMTRAIDRRQNYWAAGIGALALVGLVLALLFAPAAARAAPVTVKTADLIATFDDGCLVGVENRLTGERYFAASGGEVTTGLTVRSGLLPVAKVVRAGPAPGGYRWVMESVGAQPARVTTIARAAGREVVIGQWVERREGGIGGVEWGLRGLDLAKAKLVIPGAGGVIVDPVRAAQELTYEWPGSWQAAAVFIQGERGGLRIWTDDPPRHFKDLRYRKHAVSPHGDTATLRFATETDGSANGQRRFVSVTWRLGAYRGDWRAPAAQYRALMGRSFALSTLAGRRPAWVSQIAFVVRTEHTLDPKDLQRLAREVPPGRTLIYVPNWRTYGYDEYYPEYAAGKGVVEFVKAARRLGFHVMLHFNWAGINPGHPLRRRYDALLLRDRWTGERVGWYLDRPQDVAHQIMVLNLAFPEARRVLVDRIARAHRAIGFDGVHLDFPVLVNSTQGRHRGLNALGGAEAYLRELHAALPEVALGTEGINEVLLPCSFAQVGEIFWNPDARMGTLHPVRSFLFSQCVHLYGHLGMPNPVDSLPSNLAAVEVGMRLGSLPTLICGDTIEWQAPGVRLAVDLGRMWAAHGLQPDFDLRPDEAMAWRGRDGARVSFRREAAGWALRKDEAPMFLIAQGVNAIPAPWGVAGWPAQDRQGVFDLDPEQRYLARPGLGAAPPVRLARPEQPLLLKDCYQGAKRAVFRVERSRNQVWEATAALGEAKTQVWVKGKMGPLADGATFTLTSAACHGERRPVIFAHPPWQGASAGGITVGEFKVTLPEAKKLTLRFATGLDDVVHDPNPKHWGDGATFIISVEGKRLFEQHQNRDVGWQEHAVALDDVAGPSGMALPSQWDGRATKTIILRLATGPGPAGDVSFDWACWNNVRIEAGEAAENFSFELISDRKAQAAAPQAAPTGDGPYRYRFEGGGDSQWAALLFDVQRAVLPTRLADLPFSVAAVSGGPGMDGSVYGSGTVASIEMRGVSLRAINAHPPNQGQTRLDWGLALPEQPCRLRWSYGVRDGGQSVIFRVLVNGEVVWAHPVPEPAGWQEGTADLAKWAGQTVLVSLVTDSDGPNTCDWAHWGEPSLEGGD